MSKADVWHWFWIVFMSMIIVAAIALIPTKRKP